MRNIDLESDTVPVVGDNAMKAVAAEAQRIVDLEAEIAALELAIKDRKEELRKVKFDTLPTLLDENGIKELTVYVKLADRRLEGRIALVDHLNASLPSETAIEREKDPTTKRTMIARRGKALVHLRKIKAGDIIKSTVEVEFGTGDDARAQSLLKELKRRKLDHHVSVNVNPRTLSKLARELRQQGKPLPATLFNVNEGREAVVTIERKE